LAGGAVVRGATVAVEAAGAASRGGAVGGTGIGVGVVKMGTVCAPVAGNPGTGVVAIWLGGGSGEAKLWAGRREVDLEMKGEWGKERTRAADAGKAEGTRRRSGCRPTATQQEARLQTRARYDIVDLLAAQSTAYKYNE